MYMDDLEALRTILVLVVAVMECAREGGIEQTLRSFLAQQITELPKDRVHALVAELP